MTSERSLPSEKFSDGQLRLAYLVSKYPAVSHTFIVREILALRDRGISIDVASINDPPPPTQMTQAELAEAERTYYVKRAGPFVALAALAWMTLNHPVGVAKGFLSCLQMGGLEVSRLIWGIFYFVEASMLARWMERRSLRHLHVHFATPAAAVAVILTKMIPVTLSITVHGPDEFYDVPGYSLVKKIEAAKFVICISFFAQSQIMKLAHPLKWESLDLVRLGVDCDNFRPRPARAHEDFNVLCVGRLVPAKGQRVLILAIDLLVTAGRSVRLSLVGDGPDRLSLEQLVTEKKLIDVVTFAGSVNQDQIQEFYSQADAFAIASFAEGLPVVLMEAMAMEIPCVATRIMGIPELIEDGENGLLVPPSDVYGLASALSRLMDDSAFAQRLGRAGRIRVLQQYELGKSANRLADVFHRRLVGPI